MVVSFIDLRSSISWVSFCEYLGHSSYFCCNLLKLFVLNDHNLYQSFDKGPINWNSTSCWI